MFQARNEDFNAIYRTIVEHVLTKGETITVRGIETKECNNCIISLTDINKHKLDFTQTAAYERQQKYNDYCEKELSWYKSGCLVAEHAPSKFWQEIADSEGKIQSNYGYMILHEKKPYSNEEETSFNHAIKLLKSDQYSRQVILHYSLPNHYNTKTKDIPCTVAAQVFIRNNKLSFLVFQRSSDLHWGLIYDLPWHCYLMSKFVAELSETYWDIVPGELNMLFGSIHIYTKDKVFFDKYLQKRKD